MDWQFPLIKEKKYPILSKLGLLYSGNRSAPVEADVADVVRHYSYNSHACVFWLAQKSCSGNLFRYFDPMCTDHFNSNGV